MEKLIQRLIKTARKNIFILVALFLLVLSVVYLYPMFRQGLILLPLDLLIARYTPWYAPGTILLKNPYMQDAIVQLFPWRHFVFESFRQGVIPFWNPYQILGMPFLATLKPMVLYPFNLFFAFGEVFAWDAIQFTQIFLGMVFMYLLLSDYSTSLTARFIGAVAFGLSSLMMGLLQFGSDAHTLIWWPLLFLFSKRYLDSHKLRYVGLLALTFALCLYAGHLQYAAYEVFSLTVFWVLYREAAGQWLKDRLVLAGGLIAGAGFAAPQLLPALLYFPETHRAGLSAQNAYSAFLQGLLPPVQLARLFAPDLFGNPVSGNLSIGYIESSGYFGIVPLFFSLYALSRVKRDRRVLPFTVIFFTGMLLSIRGTGVLPYALHLPLVSSGVALRIFSVTLFAGSALAAFGLDLFTGEHSRKSRLAAFGLFLLFFAAVAGVVYWTGAEHDPAGFLRNIRYQFVYVGVLSVSVILLAFWRRKAALPVFLLLVLCVTYADLFRMGYRFITFSNRKFLYPETPVVSFITGKSRATMARVYKLTEPEISTYLGVYSLESYNPMYPQRNADLIAAVERQPSSRSDTDNKFYLNATGTELKRALDFFGVRYVVSSVWQNPVSEYFGPTVPQDSLTKIYADETYAVYENTDAFPRFAVYYRTKQADSDAQVLALLRGTAVDLRRTLIITEPVQLASGSGVWSAELTENDGNSQSYRVRTDQPGIFSVSDAYASGWTATVNGRQKPILKADYNLRAVRIPTGTSDITFRYMPPGFREGIAIACTTLVITGAVALAVMRTSGRGQSNTAGRNVAVDNRKSARRRSRKQ